MQVGGSGTIKSDINVTPLVDVVLVLLIIFMVITPVVQMGYLVRVPPKAPPGTPITGNDQIILRLMPDNHMYINRDEVAPGDFAVRIHDIMHGNQSKMVFFQGSPEVDYDTTMKFLDMARASGAKNIGIIVEAAQ
jgi:biopolymer transport protein TolR